MHPARPLSALAALLAFTCAAPSCSCGAPVITDSELAAITSVEIHGTGFGSSGSVVFADGTAVPSSTKGAVWTDTHIVMPIPQRPSRIHVHAAGGDSNAVDVEYFILRTTTIPPTADTNARPLAIATTGGRFFVDEEFHRDFQRGVAGAPGVDALLPPRPPDPGPFAAYFEHFCLSGNCSDDVDIQTQTSVLGEDVIVDSLGRVWFSEGGGLLYEERKSTIDPSKDVMVHPNHSRIVMLENPVDPAPRMRVYDVPGDRNEVIGLAWDGAKLWFCEGGQVGGGKLVRLDPEAAHFDTASPSFDFATDADPTGYELFPLPAAQAKSFPSMPLVDSDGRVWFTMYLGNAVGRLDPSTKNVEIFPLPAPRAQKGPGGLFRSGGPWRIAFVDGGDGIVFGEQYDFEITRLDAKRVRGGDPACASLDFFGKNPCMTSIAIADPNALADDSTSLLHSIAVDDRARIWFTVMGSAVPNATDDRIGFVTKDLAHVVEISPGTTLGGPNGIAFESGDVVFAEFNGQAVGVLTPVFFD